MDLRAEQALGIARILRIFFIVSSLLFLYIVFTMPSKATMPPQPALELIISAFALTNVVLGFILPGFLAKAARRAQSNAGPRTPPIQRWMSGCILSLAFFESCNLFGVVLHFVGARALVVESLFAAGLLAMLFWSPGAPPIDEGVSPTQMFPGA